MKIESLTLDFGACVEDWEKTFAAAVERRAMPTVRALVTAVPPRPSGAWRGALARALTAARPLPTAYAVLERRVRATDAVSAWDPSASYTCPKCGEEKPASAFGARMSARMTVRDRATAEAAVVWARSTVAPGRVPDPIHGARGWSVVLPTRQSQCSPCRNGTDDETEPTTAEE